jgi:hypothetical protein
MYRFSCRVRTENDENHQHVKDNDRLMKELKDLVDRETMFSLFCIRSLNLFSLFSGHLHKGRKQE